MVNKNYTAEELYKLVGIKVAIKDGLIGKSVATKDNLEIFYEDTGKKLTEAIFQKVLSMHANMEEEAVKWFYKPNWALDYKRAIDCLADGEIKILEDLVDELIDGSGLA